MIPPGIGLGISTIIPSGFPPGIPPEILRRIRSEKFSAFQPGIPQRVSLVIRTGILTKV